MSITINGVPIPTADDEVANKLYVDDSWSKEHVELTYPDNIVANPDGFTVYRNDIALISADVYKSFTIINGTGSLFYRFSKDAPVGTSFSLTMSTTTNLSGMYQIVCFGINYKINGFGTVRFANSTAVFTFVNVVDIKANDFLGISFQAIR